MMKTFGFVITIKTSLHVVIFLKFFFYRRGLLAIYLANLVSASITNVFVLSVNVFQVEISTVHCEFIFKSSRG